MSKLGKPISQRQLRVGEMIKQALGTLFIRDEAKIPNLSTKEAMIIGTAGLTAGLSINSINKFNLGIISCSKSFLLKLMR